MSDHDAGIGRLLAAVTAGRDGAAADLRTPTRRRLAAPPRTRKLTAAERAHLTARLGWSWDHLEP